MENQIFELQKERSDLDNDSDKVKMASRFLTYIDATGEGVGKKSKWSDIDATATLPNSLSIKVNEEYPSRMSHARSNLSISGDPITLVS